MYLSLTSKLIHKVQPYAEYTLKNSGTTTYTVSSTNILEGLIDSKKIIQGLDSDKLEKLYADLQNIDFNNFEFTTYIYSDKQKCLEVVQRCSSILRNLCIVEILDRKEHSAEVCASC